MNFVYGIILQIINNYEFKQLLIIPPPSSTLWKEIEDVFVSNYVLR